MQSAGSALPCSDSLGMGDAAKRRGWIPPSEVAGSGCADREP